MDMEKVVKALIVLAALTFVFAVIVAVFGTESLPVSGESLSRSSNNLSLLAIALAVTQKSLGHG
jgi:hypothetical protein